ncbi:SH3 domain-containing protein [Leptothoe sp. LEGE 181152]|nr:SH3 domain-containing protein [Leptothoe sp. LEGE 181152]
MGVIKGVGCLFCCLSVVSCQTHLSEGNASTQVAASRSTTADQEVSVVATVQATSQQLPVSVKTQDPPTESAAQTAIAKQSSVQDPGVTAIAKQLSVQDPGIKVYVMVPQRQGVLRSQDDHSRINIRTQPTTASASPHYGLPGDEVTVLEATARYQGHVWYFVQFTQSGVEGWVRDDVIEIDRSDIDTAADIGITYVDAPVSSSETLQFAPGTNEAVIWEKTVTQGSQHEYFFFADAGQELSVSLQAGDENAVFQIYSEEADYWLHLIGDYVGATSTDWSGPLPKSSTGRYRIYVRPTWADAVYSMRVAIK